MGKIEIINSQAIPLPLEDIDTDQIIPARFLKATDKIGFGQNLFRDWRYDKKDKLIPDFILNNADFSGEILIAGKNFGCGSSREHAAWALADYGFKVVISSFFADIFRNNALNNGLLPITVSFNMLDKLFSFIEANPSTEFRIDLPNQSLIVPEFNFELTFDIEPFKKKCLLEGMDTIDFLIDAKDRIKKFEETHIVY